MNLSERVKVFKDEKNSLLKDLIDYFKNNNETLEDRWKLFEESRELFPRYSWVMDIREIEVNDGNYYDDFGYDRHQTVDLVDLVYRIEDYPAKYSKFNVEQVKKEILASGYGSFIFDW
jgi:hypothetical protein